MSKYGKIARLPRHICDGLNRRLDNGSMDARSLEWLNSLLKVKHLLQTNLTNPGKSK